MWCFDTDAIIVALIEKGRAHRRSSSSSGSGSGSGKWKAYSSERCRLHEEHLNKNKTATRNESPP